jgi:CheY-like chemotaxis protein
MTDKRKNDDSETTRLDELLEDLQLAEEKAREHAGAEDENIIPWVIELRVIGTPDIIRAPVAERITFGRSDANQNINPEIDLSVYDGQRKGVSRKHARLIMRDNRLVIEDLGSSNGTYVNGQHIGVLTPVRVRDGDQLKLGSLSLQVHFVIKPHSNEDTMHGVGNALNVPTLARGQRLLILDDNKEVCAIVRFIALQAGFTVTVTHDMAAAMTHWDAGEIDALFVELLLEEGSGLNLINYVRQQSQKVVPIVATLSTAGGYREGQARSSGVDELLVKPLAVDQIVESLAVIAELLPQS